MRLGVYVVAADRYKNAPAQQIAHEMRVLDMTDFAQLTALIEEVQPDLIVPEIEAIATDALIEVEGKINPQGNAIQVVPSAYAVNLTMNREGIRRLASEELGIATSPYRFATSLVELEEAASQIGFPVVIKPVQSSSGKGQSVAKTAADLENSWKISQEGARGGSNGVKKVIVEGFVDFDYEATLLTCVAANGTTFLDPIGHLQVDGDYRISWQTQAMSPQALANAQQVAGEITAALRGKGSGYGIFGVELFIKSDQVIFSEVSPRPHDTGMVTMISQSSSEFAMHAKAILGYAVYSPQRFGSAASYAVLAHGKGVPVVENAEAVFADPGADLRIFGKPNVDGERRVAVVLALGKSTEDASKRAEKLAMQLDVKVI
jgi:phosphoribosylglycinamide formyltransferase 2